MSKDDGGPAFARPYSEDANEQDGMSLRDYFAAAAITGLILHYHEGRPVGGWHKADDENYVCRELSEVAYGYADAMLAERSKP